MSLEKKARLLIVPAAMPGKVMQVLTGTGQELIEQGRIHLHRALKAPDGIDIDTWVIKSGPRNDGRGGATESSENHITKGTVILLHPLMTSKSWFLKLGGRLAANGWDVVLMDLRAHGRSGGRYITWGTKEKLDVLSGMDQLLEEKAVREPIYVLGSSYGGTVAIQYAAMDPRCKGVIALGPPGGLNEIARRILLLASRSTVEAAVKRAGEIAGSDPEEASAVKAAARLSCPLLLVHGWWDLIVPHSHSRAIMKAAAGPKKLKTLFFAGHALEIGRERWLAGQVEILVGMSGPGPADGDRQ